jgi:hypothetical protein
VAKVAERPKAVGLAAALLWVAFAVGLVLMGERLTQRVSFFPASVLYCMLAVVFALLATLVYLVLRGHNWARITCVSLIGIRSVAAVSRASSEFGYSAAAISLTLVVVELIAAYLLLSRPSNAWFKGSRAEP